MNRISFQSDHYPKSDKQTAVTQTYAMPYYAFFAGIVMLGVLASISNGVGGYSLLFGTLLAAAVAIFLGNAMAYSKLKNSWAQIMFVKDHVSLISVHDIISGNDHHAFPLKFTNPSLHGDQIHLNYNDQVVILKRQDWDEFDLIWQWMSHTPEEWTQSYSQ